MASRAAKSWGKRNRSRKAPGWGRISKRAKRRANRKHVKIANAKRRLNKTSARAKAKGRSAAGRGLLPF